MNRRLSENATTIAFLVLAVFYLYVVQDYPKGARLIPSIVSIAVIALSVLQLVGRRFQKLKPLVEEQAEAGASFPPDRESEGSDTKEIGPASERKAGQSRGDGNDERSLGSPQYWRRVILIIAWMSFLYVLTYLLGLQVAIPIFTFAFFATVDRVSWRVTLGVTALMSGATYVVISVILKQPWMASGVLWKFLK